MRRGRQKRFGIGAMLCALFLGLSFSLARAADADAGAIAGKWYGMAGFPQDRVPLGFEFKRDNDGVMTAAFYGPVINFYGLDVPGGIARDGEKYINKDWALAFTLKGGALDGTLFGGIPFHLARTDTLPAEMPVPAFDSGPGPKWRTKLGAPIYARAAIADGATYVGNAGGMFHAINLKDGSFRWAFAAGRAIMGEALVTADAVYFVCDNGFLFKLDRGTGKEVWRYDLGDAQVSRILPHQVVANSGDFDSDIGAPKPLLIDGVLYVSSGDGSVHAVNAQSHARLWRFEGKGKLRGGVVTDGARLFAGSYPGRPMASTAPRENCCGSARHMARFPARWRWCMAG